MEMVLVSKGCVGEDTSMEIVLARGVLGTGSWLPQLGLKGQRGVQVSSCLSVTSLVTGPETVPRSPGSLRRDLQSLGKPRIEGAR